MKNCLFLILKNDANMLPVIAYLLEEIVKLNFLCFHTFQHPLPILFL